MKKSKSRTAIKGTETMLLATANVKPFLKWVGGKRQLLPELVKRLPKNFNNYFEPFVGGGALFFTLQPKNAMLSDLNPELINVYRVIKSHVEELITDLKKHKYNRDYYYRMRELDRSPDYRSLSKVERAGRIIYLNKTCYNGLYRVNSQGHFNSPFGKYVNPNIVDAENLRRCSDVLRQTKIALQSYEQIESVIQRGDFVYLDPPYLALSETSNFTSYSKESFDFASQQELLRFCQRIGKRGVKFMLSNSCSAATLSLYKGFKVEKILARRFINSRAEKRGAIPEIIVRNY